MGDEDLNLDFEDKVEEVTEEKKETKVKRTRRSKAEIEADKAKDQAKLDLYLVSLLHSKDMKLEAKDAEEAIEKFKKHNGILASIHPFKVIKVEA